MNSERERQITSIFHSAIEREGAERRAFLDGACANDAELRREVESLIHSHENAGSLMDPPAYERDASLVDEMDQTAAVPKPPDAADVDPTIQIGLYRVLLLLARRTTARALARQHHARRSVDY